WFSEFPPFTYDYTSGIQSNFNRLAYQRQWGPKLKGNRWIQCQKMAFTALYATNAHVGKLEKWQALCRDVHIHNPPDSITQCKKILGSRKVLVNLVNLIDHRLIGVPVIRFKNYNEFLAYTNSGRKFPREEAKEEGFIKVLLRQL
ncbi:uncharacterized protein K460DRAFT_294177, partial [Cucurbitaria berberidis CBS 394.84]